MQKTTEDTATAGVRFFRLLAFMLLAPEKLRVGRSGHPEKSRFTIVKKDDDGKEELLGWGDKVPLAVKMILPLYVRTDTGNLPIVMLSETIGNEDPDEWIDRNEEKVIPKGFTSDQVVTDFAVDGECIIAVTAVSEARERLLVEYNSREGEVTHLLPPLQGLAEVAGRKIKGIWFIWKIDSRGSVIVRVESGKVVDVCHYWADNEQLEKNPTATVEGILPLIRSMANDQERPKVLHWMPEYNKNETNAVTLSGCEMIDLPEDKAVPETYMEAYGNAVCSDDTVQLLPFGRWQKGKQKMAAWCKAMFVLRVACMILAILAVVAGSYIGLSRFIVYRDRVSMKDVDRMYAEVIHASTQLDSLRQRFEKKAAILAGESRITTLLSELQEVLPDGVRTEELAIAERSEELWKLDIIAFTKSSSLMQPMMTRLGKVTGVRDVRMAYSEQVGKKKSDRGIRFKLEATWR